MKDDRMGIAQESTSGEGKQLTFHVIARNQSLEESKERSDGVKTNLGNNSLFQIQDAINCANAFRCHTASIRRFIFLTLSLLCLNNLVGHAAVFFPGLATDRASRNAERRVKLPLHIALTAGSQHLGKSRRNQDLTAAASLKLLWLLGALL